MAVVYTETFTGSNGASWSADWATSSSLGVATVDIQSNKGRMLTTSSSFNTQRAILGAGLWNGADGEVLVETFLPIEDDNLFTYWGIVLRGSGSWSVDDSNFPTSGYTVICDAKANRIQFWKSVGSVPTQIGTDQSFSFSWNVTYRVRFRVEGSTLTVRVWDAAGVEPGTPTYTQTDSSITSSGQLQLWFRNSVASPMTLHWDTLSIDNLSSASSVTGTVARTLGGATVAASGSHATGTVARTLAAATVAASGSFSSSDYTADFTGNPGSGWPAGWTTTNNGTGGTIDIQSNKGRMLTTATSGSNTQRAVLSAAVWSAVDGEAVVDSFAAVEDDPGELSIVLRGSGVWSADDTNLPTSGYTVFVNQPANYFRLYRSTGSVPTLVGTQQSFSFAFGVTYRHRFRVENTTLKYKVWDAAGAEPGWTYETTDSNVTGSGQFMLAFRNGLPVVRSMLWDNVALDNLSVVGTSGTFFRTLANVSSAATGSSVAGSAARTLGAATVAAAGTHAVAGTVARTLGNVTSTTAGQHGVTGTVARPLAPAMVAAAGGSSGGGGVARTLANLTSQAVGGHGVAGTVARTLTGASLAAVGASGTTTTGTVAVTLEDVATTSPLTDEFGSPILDDSGVAELLDENSQQILDENSQTITEGAGEPILVPGAVGLHGLGGTVARTLGNVTAVGAGTVGRVGTVAVTLGEATVAASGASGATGTSANTLGAVTSTTAGSHGVPGSLAVYLDEAMSTASGSVTIAGNSAVTLADTTSTASGTHDPVIIAGNVARTLDAATSSASGGHGLSGALAATLDAAVAAAGGSSQHGTVTETLDATTVAASGTAGQMPVSGIAAIILADLTTTAAGYPTVQGSVARILVAPTSVAEGSSTVGTVAVTFDDVTSATVGTGSILEYAGVTYRDRGHTISMRERN